MYSSKDNDILLARIKADVVTLCARSAHTRPRITTRSQVVSCSVLALLAASLKRATFCAGVSFGFAGREEISIVVAVPILEEACGPVDVNRVASEAERGILNAL